MSNQGNIAVTTGDGTVYLTTSRCGGHSTAKTAQDNLVRLGDGSFEEYTSLNWLSHDPRISRPIPRLGNTDTPTVYVDWLSQEVSWVEEHTQKRLGVWTFAEYVDLDLKMVPGYVEEFENS